MAITRKSCTATSAAEAKDCETIAEEPVATAAATRAPVWAIWVVSEMKTTRRVRPSATACLTEVARLTIGIHHPLQSRVPSYVNAVGQSQPRRGEAVSDSLAAVKERRMTIPRLG